MTLDYNTLLCKQLAAPRGVATTLFTILDNNYIEHYISHEIERHNDGRGTIKLKAILKNQKLLCLNFEYECVEEGNNRKSTFTVEETYYDSLDAYIQRLADIERSEQQYKRKQEEEERKRAQYVKDMSQIYEATMLPDVDPDNFKRLLSSDEARDDYKKAAEELLNSNAILGQMAGRRMLRLLEGVNKIVKAKKA